MDKKKESAAWRVMKEEKDTNEMTDEEFVAWCDSWKPCKRCGKTFVGPNCTCEYPLMEEA